MSKWSRKFKKKLKQLEDRAEKLADAAEETAEEAGRWLSKLVDKGTGRFHKIEKAVDGLHDLAAAVKPFVCDDHGSHGGFFEKLECESKAHAAALYIAGSVVMD